MMSLIVLLLFHYLFLISNSEHPTLFIRYTGILSLLGCDAYLEKELEFFEGFLPFSTTPTLTWGEGQLEVLN